MDLLQNYLTREDEEDTDLFPPTNPVTVSLSSAQTPSATDATETSLHTTADTATPLQNSTQCQSDAVVAVSVAAPSTSHSFGPRRLMFMGSPNVSQTGPQFVPIEAGMPSALSTIATNSVYLTNQTERSTSTKLDFLSTVKWMRQQLYWTFGLVEEDDTHEPPKDKVLVEKWKRSVQQNYGSTHVST